MLVLGGGNRQQFHSFRSLLLLDLGSLTWSRVRAVGATPAALAGGLIYHTSACAPSSKRRFADTHPLSLPPILRI